MKRTLTTLFTLCLFAVLLLTLAHATGTDISAAFTDSNFLARVYDALGKAPGEAITADECAGVKVLDVHGSGIESLAGIEYFTRLEELDSSDNQLTAIDLSRNARMKRLYVESNRLSALDVSQLKTLEILNCSENLLTSLDISQNKSLQWLDCSSNRITALNVSYSMILERLYCQNNQLTSLDLRNNAALLALDCSQNNMSSAFKVKGTFSLQMVQILAGNGQFKFYTQNRPGSIEKFPGYIFHAAPFYLISFLLFPLRLILGGFQ